MKDNFEQVRAWFKESSVPTVLISIILAVSLWAAVQLTTEKPRIETFSGLPVRISGQQNLKNATGMSVIEGADATISMQIEANGSDMTNLQRGGMRNLGAELRVSDLTDPGRYRLGYTYDRPSGNSVVVRGVSPETIEIWVDRIVTVELPILTTVDGAPGEGYYYDVPLSDQQTVTASGPETVIDTLSYVRAEMTAHGATSNLSGEAALSFVDHDGNEIDAEENHLSILSGAVTLSLGVRKEAVVPLRVTPVEAPGIPASSAQISLSVDAVHVLGQSELVDRLAAEGLLLGKVELEQLFEGDGKTELMIDLPNTVSLLNGEPRRVTVTVTFEGITERDLEITELQTDENEEWTVEMLASAIRVRVRGLSEIVDAMTGEELIARLTDDPTEHGAGVRMADLEVILENVEGVALIDPPETVSVIVRAVEPVEEPVEDAAAPDDASEEDQ